MDGFMLDYFRCLKSFCTVMIDVDIEFFPA